MRSVRAVWQKGAGAVVETCGVGGVGGVAQRRGPSATMRSAFATLRTEFSRRIGDFFRGWSVCWFPRGAGLRSQHAAETDETDETDEAAGLPLSSPERALQAAPLEQQNGGPVGEEQVGVVLVFDLTFSSLSKSRTVIIKEFRPAYSLQPAGVAEVVDSTDSLTDNLREYLECFSSGVLEQVKDYYSDRENAAVLVWISQNQPGRWLNLVKREMCSIISKRQGFERVHTVAELCKSNLFVKQDRRECRVLIGDVALNLLRQDHVLLEESSGGLGGLPRGIGFRRGKSGAD